jgi:Flagellar hook-length control protein FliK
VDIVLSPATVLFNTQSGTPTPVLQAGDVVDALVVALLGDDKVRLSVANTLIEVDTKVPLVAGTTIRLAVKTTSDGIQLVVVDPAEAAVAPKGSPVGTAPVATEAGGTAAATPSASPSPATTPSAGTAPTVIDVGGQDASSSIASTVAPGTDLLVQAGSDADIAAHADTPALALSAAMRVAAAQQNGLAPVFADAAVAATTLALPPAVRAAASQLLALRIPLTVDANPKVSGNVVTTPTTAGNTSDAAISPPALAAISPQALKAAVARSGLFLEARLASPTGDGGPVAVAPSEDLKAALVVLRQVVKTWLDSVSPAGRVDDTLPVVTPSPSITPGARSATDASGEGRALPPGPSPAEHEGTDAGPARIGPPPPYRGGPTTAQPPSPPSIAADAAPRAIGEKLLHETDAALARQTLLQAASLDQADPQASRSDSSGPRWNFEIPLATPQGTAIAQFEIARDGKNETREGIKPVWRARFTVDIEPIGRVHAQIALTGVRTAVTMWAEREDTAKRLRENSGQLADALKGAELEPGDVLVREGAPPQPRTQAVAGRFIDRAS